MVIFFVSTCANQGVIVILRVLTSWSAKKKVDEIVQSQVNGRGSCVCFEAPAVLISYVFENKT